MSVRTELEVARELKRVRKILADIRADNGEAGDADENIMYGAQQALVWMLRQGMSPIQLDAVILKLAEDLDHG